ncbi:MAG: hypothetical protein WD025_08690, partial [Bacteriovoracaceae bacterium]
MKLYRHLLFFLSLCLLAGCGDMLMSKKEKKMRQMMKCSADPSALSKIFTENIKPELACLGESLKLFVDIVKTDRPGNLSYKELSVYIKKNLDSVDSSLFEPLKGFFEINSLLSGDDPLYIKKENINSLMTMLALINEVMVENRVAEYFTDDSTLDYQEHSKRKAAVFNAFVTMERALRDFFKSNNNEIDLIAFLKKFENMDNSDTLKNSANLLFIKKMFLGGDKKILTARELRRVTMMLGDVSKIAYDIIHLPNVRHSQNEEEEIIESLKENLETLTRNLHIHPHENEPVMTLDDIFAVVGHHFPQFGFLSQYKKSILKAKEIFLNNNSPIFTAKEVKT